MKDNIKDFPGYHISREGLLYSRYNKIGELTDNYKVNQSYTRSNGYQQVVLKIRKLGLLRRAYIHRLVAEAYIPNPLGKPCVCHKDNNRTNNHVDNLYWGTYKENMKQASIDGRLSNKKALRAIVFSDLHICDYPKHKTRLDTALSILDIISDKCMEYQIPAIHLGDLFHKPEVISNELFSIIMDKFMELDSKDWVMYTISGNHASCNTNSIGKPIISWDNTFSKSFRWINCLDFKRVHIGNLYIYGVPYIDHNIGLNDYIKGLELVGGDRSKHILLLHTDYPGARDTDGMEVGSVENLNVNIVSRFDLVLIGHIHKPQRLSKKVYMVGAPYQQRRTDKNCDLGYWELYSDMSMKFIPFEEFPRFIDVEKEEDIKDDGNYYTLISKQVEELDNTTNKITRNLSKKRLVSRYLRKKGIKDLKKKSLLIDIIKEVEDD